MNDKPRRRRGRPAAGNGDLLLKELLRGVAEDFVSSANFGGRGDSWQERIRHCFDGRRRVCRSNPAAARLIGTSGIPDQVFRPMEITLNALGDAGIHGDDALRAFYLLVHFTVGQAFYEARPPTKGLDPRRCSTGVGEEAEAGPPEWDFDQAFEFGLTTILDGLYVRSQLLRRTVG